MHTRRTFLALSVGSLAALGLAGCSDSDSAATAGAAPKRGGDLTFATTSEPDSWDLHISVSSISALVLRAVYDSLVHQKPDGTFEPWLAKSWTVSDDGLAYTFELRDDVTFHDGTPFDAQAVKANFDHVVAPATASRNAKTLLGPYDRTEVTGPHTAVIHLKSPYSPLLGGLSTAYLGFHSPKLLTGKVTDATADGKSIVSTGPFAFTSLTPTQRAVFTRRTGYGWVPASLTHAGDAYLQRYTVEFLADDAARVGALTSGQLDVADQVPANRLAQLKTQPGIALVGRDQVGAPFMYGLNTTKAPFDELNVRLAFQTGVDVRSITNGLFQGAYVNGWSAVTAVTPGYDHTLENSWGYNRDKALSLLEQAGYTATDGDGYRTRDGKRLSVNLIYAAQFTTEEQKNYHTALKDGLKQLGFELVLKPLDTAAIVQAYAIGDYHLGAGAATGTDASVLRNSFYSKQLPANGGANVARVDDKEIDVWLDQALRAQDTATQYALYGKVQHKVIAEAYVLPTFVAKRTFGTQDKVGGFTLGAQNIPVFEDVWVG